MTSASPPVALVTGASSGMGADIASRLLSEMYVVYAAARRTERLATLADKGAKAMALDVTDEAQCVAAVERIIAEQGRIDVLINAAGYGQYGAIEDVPLDLARRQIETNLLGPARLIQLVLPHMRGRHSGKIVNISSSGGKFAFPLGGWYHASKFALEGYSDSLRNEVRQFGIDVVVIEPGGIRSEWSGIAAEENRRLSGEGAYADLVAAEMRLRKQEARAPGPEVITDLVVRALRARRPRPRYHAGLAAGPLLFLRRQLSDRMFDRLIMMAYRGRGEP
ncbi:MAG: short-chain dehydrogenase/reductase [Rhizobiales bacterium 24-66-13]|nr:MAG: short-chain dehydrogenase/reductase [Rhizobiales bacterium 35-66-30]OYZ81792.1 MAG: short-chain dehydrogenase/reductase [Rhizobiales bacterium 24-66-13]OZB09655.1 MAG: short-chain dehydrogenase/reductase [Rhizobiales bacterium 39-66-18]HQS46941.1 oxidoreductase [Xanthobacteraceae bacterium]